ncbi:hypothetical protein C8R43DRAFT_1032598 [Mycena crocata]|nr:hypothetical protein C8R43DRAFT_1032598 [Mycena crocata]
MTSRPRSTRSSANYSGLGRLSEYEAAAVYGEPALSDRSSDEQIARALSDSKRSAAIDAQRRSSTISRALSYASSSASTLLGSGSSSSGSSRSSIPRSHASSHASNTYSPTPTPRYAADEVIARNLARSWHVGSVQSDIIANPEYTRPAGPPLVVRSTSPSPSNFSARSSTSSSSSQRTPYQTPTRPLSPLLIATRPLSSNGTSFLHSPSLRSMSSISSVRSAASGASVRSAASVSSVQSGSSARSGSSIRSTSSRASITSLLSSVARSSRHAPLQTAAQALRASLPPSLARSASSVSTRSSVSSRSSASIRLAGSSASTPRRAGSVRSVSTANSHARSVQDPDPYALARLHTLATSPTRCARPGCGAIIPLAPLDNLIFPQPTSSPFPTAPLPHYTSPSAPSFPSALSSHSSTRDASTEDTYMPPPPPALVAALYAQCPACTLGHCRGCGAPTPAPIPTHCAAVRALGALAALVAFDRAHSAFDSSKSGAPPTPKRDQDKTLLGPLHALVYFLSAPPATPPLSPPLGVGMPGLLLAAGDDYPYGADGDGSLSEYGDVETDGAIPALLVLSRVPVYAAGLLRAGMGMDSSRQTGGQNYYSPSGDAEVDVGTWMARAPAFSAVLRVLRALGDAGPGGRGVLARRLPAENARSGGVEVWLRRGVAESSAGNGYGDGSLLALVRRLEPARAALLRLAGATTFAPTVGKAHALCDAILYLLLQDVLGEGV